MKRDHGTMALCSQGFESPHLHLEKKVMLEKFIDIFVKMPCICAFFLVHCGLCFFLKEKYDYYGARPWANHKRVRDMPGYKPARKSGATNV